MKDISVDTTVVSKKDLMLALSEGVDVPKGTKGVVKEVNEGGPEGRWLHVLWDVGGRRGKTFRNVDPSDVEVDQDPSKDPDVMALLYGYGGPFGSRGGMKAFKTVV